MRTFLAALMHETNSFSPLPTTMRSFESGLIHRPGNAGTLARSRQTFAYGEALTALEEAGDDVVPGLCAWAEPSGIVSRATYEQLRDELLHGLRDAGPVDSVLLVLHGAMHADGYDGCEADILRRARGIVGDSVPIGALLDLHGNVGPAMLESAPILVACKEYPHTDYLPRARELRAILAASVTRESSPVTYLRRLPMIALLGTTESPMREFVQQLKNVEGKDGVLSVSTMQGFAWSDVPDMGASLLVVYDDARVGAALSAAKVADSLAANLVSIRTGGVLKRLPLDDAIEAALAARTDRGPVVLADSSDNPGGGAACDSTFVLRALLDRGVTNVAVGMLWDPQAALIAADAGVGACIALRVGGKVGPLSGQPIDLMVEVIAVNTDLRQLNPDGRGAESTGLSVALRSHGIELVIHSIRRQTWSTNVFTDLGIDLRTKQIVVVKSSQHFRASFDAVASSTVYCNSPGSLNLDLQSLPYRRIGHPIWPIDDFDLQTAIASDSSRIPN